MYKSQKTIFVLVLIAAGIVTGSAQTSIGEVPVTTAYDKNKDLTTIEFQQLLVAQTSEHEVYINASVDFAGQKLKTVPADVFFIISIISRGSYKYPDTIPMKVKVNGKPLNDVTMLNLDKRMIGKDYLETLGTRMKYDVFMTLAKAQTAELMVHDTTIKLSASHISKLDELARLVKP